MRLLVFELLLRAGLVGGLVSHDRARCRVARARTSRHGDRRRDDAAESLSHVLERRARARGSGRDEDPEDRPARPSQRHVGTDARVPAVRAHGSAIRRTSRLRPRVRHVVAAHDGRARRADRAPQVGAAVSRHSRHLRRHDRRGVAELRCVARAPHLRPVGALDHAPREPYQSRFTRLRGVLSRALSRPSPRVVHERHRRRVRRARRTAAGGDAAPQHASRGARMRATSAKGRRCIASCPRSRARCASAPSSS